MHVDCITTRENVAGCSGSWLSLQRLCRRMAAQGHRIEVLAAHGDGSPGLAGPHRQRVAAFAASLERRWRADRPDAVHVELPGPTGAAARDAARRLGLPVSASFHHLHLYVPEVRRARMRTLLADFHSACDATVATCAASRDLLLAMGGPAAEVIPDGVDQRVFDPARRSAGRRRLWGADPGDTVVLWAGRMEVAKGLDLLQAALAGLHARDPRLRQVLAGDGSGGAGLRRGLPWALHLGMVAPEAMPEVLASADVLLFTSPDEPWGNVVLEAAASGLAIVARSGGAMREVLLPAGACWDPPPQDAPACAAAVATLAGDGAARARLGANARAAACGVSLDVAAGRWLELWQRLSRRGRPS